MSEYVDAHRETYERIAALVGPLSDPQLQLIVPACPHWTVHDTVSHLTGLAVDFLGDLTSIMSPGFWDHDEVDRREIFPRRSRSVSEVLVEWAEVSSRFEDVIASAPPPLAGGIVGDFVCHEHDLRAALGQPGQRDSQATRLGLDIYARAMAARVTAAGAPALSIVAGDRTWTLGDGPVGASVSAPPFEMFRALTGRRTQDQVAGFAWTGDSHRYLSSFSMFEWPDTPLDE